MSGIQSIIGGGLWVADNPFSFHSFFYLIELLIVLFEAWLPAITHFHSLHENKTIIELNSIHVFYFICFMSGCSENEAAAS